MILVLEMLLENMEAMTNEQRLEVVAEIRSRFCLSCGRKLEPEYQRLGLSCQCENDE